MAKKYPHPSQIGLQWTPPNECVSKLTLANQRYEFGYSDEEISVISKKLKKIPKQPDNFKPISLNVRPRGDLSKSWGKIRQWFIDSLADIGINLEDSCILDAELLVTNLSIQYPDNFKNLGQITIDICKNRVEFRYKDEFGKQVSISGQLGVEFFVLFALHPQAFRRIDMPPIEATGVKLHGYYTPKA